MCPTVHPPGVRGQSSLAETLSATVPCHIMRVMTSEPVGEQPSGWITPMSPAPEPLPVTWQLSRWRRAQGFKYVAYFVLAGLWLQGIGQEVWGLVGLGTAGLFSLLVGWLVLFPGRVRLDGDGVRWGRRNAAWVRVAPFRLNRAGDFVQASTYLLPTSPEQERLQEVGSLAPEEVDVPAWVAGMSPWRVVALLNHYRAEALERDRLGVADPARASTPNE